MRKTLGGDRVGSGKKMQVDTQHYNRSTQDLSFVWRNTQTHGTLVPCMSLLALVGDTFDIDADVSVLTPPTVGALFASDKVQLDVYQIPIRLYNSLLHNNALKIAQDISQVKFPVYQLRAPAWEEGSPENFKEWSQIHPSSLLAYFDVRGIGANMTGEAHTRDFNAVELIGYWDTYKNYYAAKFENEGAAINTAIPTLIANVGDFKATPTLGAEKDVVYIDNYVPYTGQVVNMPTGGVIVIDYTDEMNTNHVFVRLTNQIMWEGKMTSDVPISFILKDIVIEATTLTGSFPEMAEVPAGFIWGIVYWRYATYYELAEMTEIRVERFDLENIDDMRNQILAWNSRMTPFSVNGLFQDTAPYKFSIGTENNKNLTASVMNGLALKTYQSDVFNNWLNAEDMAELNAKSNMNVVGNQLTMDTFIMAKKIYEYYNDIAASGSTYDDWLDVTYDETRYTRAEIPMYMGGLSQEVVYQEVVSNTAAQDQPLGSIGARGVLAKGKKGGRIHIKVNEPSIIMGLISITPRIDYSQGNSFISGLKTLDDIHKPAFDQIGFQDSVNERRAWWSTYFDAVEDDWITTSAGKVPAWLDYMTNVNKTYGNFAINDGAGSQMFMTHNRMYEPAFNMGNGSSSIKDLTVYVDPVKYNGVFADQRLNAMNFWVQIGFDITARRKMSAKIMPRV